MIKATVNKGEVSCNIEGKGTQILAELTVLADSVIEKISDEDEDLKKEVIKAFCENLHYIN